MVKVRSSIVGGVVAIESKVEEIQASWPLKGEVAVESKLGSRDKGEVAVERNKFFKRRGGFYCFY